MKDQSVTILNLNEANDEANDKANEQNKESSLRS